EHEPMKRQVSTHTSPSVDSVTRPHPAPPVHRERKASGANDCCGRIGSEGGSITHAAAALAARNGALADQEMADWLAWTPAAARRARPSGADGGRIRFEPIRRRNLVIWSSGHLVIDLVIGRASHDE